MDRESRIAAPAPPCLLRPAEPSDELEKFIDLRVTLLFQGTFALLAEGPVCKPCIRNEPCLPSLMEGATHDWPKIHPYARARRPKLP